MMTELQNSVIQKIKEQKMIVILRGIPEDKLINTVGAIIDGGISLVEITFDHTSKDTLLQTANQIRAVKEHFGERVEIGAGTVIDVNDVIMAKDAGAAFMISPNTSKDVIELTKKFRLVSIPGAYTPTEICNAYSWGADFVKIFPITGKPEDYLKAIKAPLKHIPMLAVGGVTPENAAQVLRAGAEGIGVGSNLVKAADVAKFESAEDFSAITRRVHEFIAAIKSV